MAEPQAQPNGPQETPLPQRPQPASADPQAADVLFNAAAEPTDDTPTIISKKVPAPVPADEAIASVLRGRHLAHYELLEPVGVGGMAAVLRARDTQLDRTVALKILPPDMAADIENVRRFHQEARAAARLDHENIARAFFCGEDQGLHFIAFEFVEGDNLRNLLERRGRIPVPEAITYMLQIAAGLAHAASRGVVHRDIKPSNIIITPTGRAKLVDMGLARSLHGDHGLTQSGVTLGTFDYISPEQAMEPRDADARSDIYSLGCTFYHMLTGQPPVPDGTAAKKLHHHQHVAPVDPRQLNPTIPDDVAATLARMMAKDPRARYQRPEHLVQHLLQLAQKLGVGSEVPDGVLFVDAPLPGPPRTRPLLLAALAVAAVVALVLIFGPGAPWPAPPRGPERGPAGAPSAASVGTSQAKSDRPGAEPAAPTGRPGNEVVPPADTGPASAQVHSARELLELLASKPKDLTITLANDLNLTRAEQLIFAGEPRDTLVLKAADGTHPTIRLKYDGGADDTWAALTVQGGQVRVVGIRFLVDAAEAPRLNMAAVAQSGGHLTLEKCEFVQANPSKPGPDGLSAVSVTGPADGKRPILVLQGCLFQRGQRAVTVTGPALVQPSNCAFGPQTAAVFHVQAGKTDSELEAADLQLSSCTTFVEGAVFRLDARTACRIEATNCLFGRPTGDAATPGVAALVQQARAPAGTFQYRDQRNAYYNLKAYRLRGAAPENAVTRWDDFRTSVAGDEQSHELATSPWTEADPLAALERQEPQKAFRLKDTLPSLRQLEDATRPLGVLVCTWGHTYPDDRLPPLGVRSPTEAVARKEKCVDPTVAESGNGVYPTLAQALGDARPGDVILIKHNGPLKVGTVRLEKPTLDVTIKAHPDWHPVLLLGETTEAEAALFRLHDGQLRLEGLEFHLQPPRTDFKTQTVAALVGDGQCTFKDCVVTLEETREVQQTVATVADPSSVMRMGPASAPRPGPRVRFEGCFVRGAGDLVAVKPSRAFELRVEESLVALEGSLLVVDGNPREQAASPSGQVSLRRVTAYLSDHLVLLRACKEEGKTTRGLAPTQLVSVLDCLFAAANGKALVHLDWVDTDDQMKRLFLWGEGRHNAYSNFTHLLDQQPRDETMMALPPYDRTRWERFTQEADGRYERAKFAAPPEEGQLAKVQPADFKVKVETELQGYGADVERLPRPTEEANDAEPLD